jgi:hypothetical protein
MASFAGAVNYTELRGLPIPELLRLHRENARIGRIREAQAQR